MTSMDTYQLKWHSHSSHLNGSVAALLRSERFTDVVLCTLDGSQIPAHKFILSSCSVYLCNLFEGQRSATRMGGMLYVVLPSEISTKALKILVEYMYKGETTVSNEVLDTVLKAGEMLKIRGLWRQTDENSTPDSGTVEKTPTTNTTTNVITKQVVAQKKAESEVTQPKITVKKDDKLLKTYPVQAQNITRPMFIGPPKLVFIKTTEGTGGQAGLRPIAPKGQTILVTPDINKAIVSSDTSEKTLTAVLSVPTEKDSSQTVEDITPPRILRRPAPEKRYGKKARTEKSMESDENVEVQTEHEEKSNDSSKKSTEKTLVDVTIKEEPEWDASSIEEEERSIAEMFQSEIIKAEPADEMDIEDEGLIYSPLTCELCAEVFTMPAAWVRHVEGHAAVAPDQHTRKRKHRSASDDTEETMALLRCDLCQKHFPNPAEWVRHIQSTHTETELAISNNSAPPKRHNRFTEGVQNKTCAHCKKSFPSHASMLIHMRTHTGERPFVCGLCNKGFNVKSNLLRHLRTLHDQIISPGRLDDDEGPSTSTDSGGGGGEAAESELKNES
ncbi:Protein bric-a-brac 2 [Eumeta japonica]|uniref:Protein bric-a-brac 2 n=1 Tax=Eumeta variegata TaxID=151549 RepID=A0A4C1W8T6_EUMVA|nr:Protein bric-a-brac 2 [Eumeta japonica]